jgi:hypothetical protein
MGNHRGRGKLDWNRIIDALYAAGYDGDIAVEHEDPVWGGTLDKTLQGMQIAAHTLRPPHRCRGGSAATTTCTIHRATLPPP